MNEKRSCRAKLQIVYTHQLQDSSSTGLRLDNISDRSRNDLVVAAAVPSTQEKRYFVALRAFIRSGRGPDSTPSPR